MAEKGEDTRRHDLDFIRVGLFGLLIVYHAGLVFGTRAWLVHTDSPSRAFDVISLVLHPWRISLLFMISGITTAMLAKRLSPAAIRGMRSRQLIPPLLFGIFVIVPPQIYVAATAMFGLNMSYLDFWLTCLRFGSIAGRDGAPISPLSLEHLWFIAYLWVYTFLLTLAVALGGGQLARIEAASALVLRGSGVLIWPVLYLAALRLCLYPIFGESLSVSQDWYTHLVYFSFFLFGYLIADNRQFWDAMVARRGQAALIAGLSLTVMIGLFLVFPNRSGGTGILIVGRIVRSAYQWSTIVAILGVCRMAIKRPHRVISYLNGAMLSYYVMHQTILLLFAYWLQQTYGLGTGSFALIIGVTAVGCAATYEIQRRTLRLLTSRRPSVTIPMVAGSSSPPG